MPSSGNGQTHRIGGLRFSHEGRSRRAVLFGAVSVSSDYQAISRELMVDFLRGRLSSGLSELVKPRCGYRKHAFAPKYVKRLSDLLGSIEELSASVSDVERDGKGISVLIRQYLRVGGELLGFNIDPKFSNALDVLVLADLRAASPAMLARCMSRGSAATFRQ